MDLGSTSEVVQLFKRLEEQRNLCNIIYAERDELRNELRREKLEKSSLTRCCENHVDTLRSELANEQRKNRELITLSEELVKAKNKLDVESRQCRLRAQLEMQRKASSGARCNVPMLHDKQEMSLRCQLLQAQDSITEKAKADEPGLQDKVDASPQTGVVALSGPASSGGCQVILACHQHVAAPKGVQPLPRNLHDETKALNQQLASSRLELPALAAVADNILVEMFNQQLATAEDVSYPTMPVSTLPLEEPSISPGPVVRALLFPLLMTRARIELRIEDTEAAAQEDLRSLAALLIRSCHCTEFSPGC